jgi:hypothetical protein
MVFVDDVATAVLLAAEHDAAVGEAFLVSGSGFRTRYLARILRRLRKNAWETKSRSARRRYPCGEGGLAASGVRMRDAGLELELAIAQDRCLTRLPRYWVAWNGGAGSVSSREQIFGGRAPARATAGPGVQVAPPG